MRSLSFCLLFLFFAFNANHAQTLAAKWTGKQLYDNKRDGFFQSFLGGNSKVTYALYANRTKRSSKEKIRLVAFDSETMNQLAAVTVADKRNKETKAKYQDLVYYRTIVLQNFLFVVWTKETRNKTEFFAERFDAKLNRETELVKIFETPEGLRSYRNVLLFLISNKDLNNSFAVGVELTKARGEDPKCYYKIIDTTLLQKYAGEFTVQLGSSVRQFSSVYQYGADGNVHIETRVYVDRSQKRTDNAYTVYSIVKPPQNTITSIPLKFEKQNVFDVGLRPEKDFVKIYGFFCDLTKDPNGEDTHGIFYCLVNTDSAAIEKMNFAYFSKDQLDKLFANDEQDRRDRTIFAGRNKVVSEEESLGSFYEIENVQSVDSTDIVLFCSMMRNISRVNCDARGICNTYYYCQKSNVTAFRIAADGKIVWASNLDRYASYDGWDVKDVNVISPDKKSFYVTYGSVFSLGKERTFFGSRKSTRHSRDFLEFAVFDYETGSFRKDEMRLNPAGTKRRELKSVSPLAIKSFEDKFYVHSIEVAPKPGVCFTAICFPVYLILLSNGDSYHGAGYLGTIYPGR